MGADRAHKVKSEHAADRARVAESGSVAGHAGVTESNPAADRAREAEIWPAADRAREAEGEPAANRAYEAEAPAADSCALDAMQVDTTGIDAQLAIVLSYDGAPFAGFARQPGQFTVQGQVEQALSLALRRPVEVVCAGRTDAGVHARAQVVSFPVSRDELEQRNLFKLKRSLQALTDEAIAIQSIAVMPPDFSARFSAVEREYRYLVVPGARKPLFLRDWCWDVKRDLDVDAMNAAAAYLVGEHDFKSFCLAASAEGKNTVRILKKVQVKRVNVLGEEAISIRVVGTAFLHSMVRSIVGTLVAVGAGRRDSAWVAEVLEARDRRAAGENAPAAGLVFWRVAYRDGLPCYERDALTAEDGAYALPPLTSHGQADGERAAEAPETTAAAAPGAGEPRVTLKTAAAPAPGAGEPRAKAAAPAPAAGEPHAMHVTDAAHDAQPDAAGGMPNVSAQDVAVAQRVMDAIEEAEPEDVAALADARPRGDSFFQAALQADLPQAVVDAANKPAPPGVSRRNVVEGPAVAAAPRTKRVAPADPQPAPGEVSFSFEVPRESAAVRAVKRQKREKRGLLGGLFGKRGGHDA